MIHHPQSILVRSREPLGWLVCLVLLTGCGSKYPPVNVGSAQEALTLALESWKDGKKPDDLREESPPISVEELDWSKGAKLLEYEIVSDDEPVDSSLIAWVKIKLSMADGKVTETTAKYIVSTSPELSVYRIMMR